MFFSNLSNVRFDVWNYEKMVLLFIIEHISESALYFRKYVLDQLFDFIVVDDRNNIVNVYFTDGTRFSVHVFIVVILYRNLKKKKYNRYNIVRIAEK